MITTLILLALFMYTVYQINNCFVKDKHGIPCRYITKPLVTINKWLTNNVYITMILAVILGAYVMKVTL